MEPIVVIMEIGFRDEIFVESFECFSFCFSLLGLESIHYTGFGF